MFHNLSLSKKALLFMVCKKHSVAFGALEYYIFVLDGIKYWKYNDDMSMP